MNNHDRRFAETLLGPLGTGIVLVAAGAIVASTQIIAVGLLFAGIAGGVLIGNLYKL